MANAPQQGLTSLFQGFSDLGNAQKLGFMLALAAAIAMIAGLWMWSQTPDYRVLYGNLSDRDGGAVIASLQQLNIPYKMADGGGAILVPSSQVYDTRLKLAAQGLPRGGTVGFELMENQKLGTSQFQEQVNYQRALEGELARSIQSLSSVQGARVHLAIPKPSVFTRDQQQPTASILVSLYPGRVLEANQVSGIVHMVSSSIPALTVKNVTIVDQSGNLLNPRAGSTEQTGLDPDQLSYLQEVEAGYIKRIEGILVPILGAENVRAQVAADLDFSQIEQTAETFKPNPGPTEAAVRSQQSAETNGGAGQPASGVPGALSNQPPGAATAPINAPGGRPATGAATTAGNASVNAHKESTVNYEVDKTIKHVRQPVGAVKRLSVAVVVNYRKLTDKAGKSNYRPLAQQEMTQINNLVREAMGFSQPRGDTLNVVNASFNLPEKEIAPELPVWKEPSSVALAKEVLKNLLIAGVAFYLVFGVLRPLFKELMRPRPKPQVTETALANMQHATAVGNYEENLRAVKEVVKQDPRIVANVVKDWVGKDE
jgi:flagellar M-ring protein FliF